MERQSLFNSSYFFCIAWLSIDTFLARQLSEKIGAASYFIVTIRASRQQLQAVKGSCHCLSVSVSSPSVLHDHEQVQMQTYLRVKNRLGLFDYHARANRCHHYRSLGLTSPCIMSKLLPSSITENTESSVPFTLRNPNSSIPRTVTLCSVSLSLTRIC